MSPNQAFEVNPDGEPPTKAKSTTINQNQPMSPNQTLEVNPEEGQPPTNVKSTTTNQSQPMSTNQALEVDRSSQVKAIKVD